MDARHNGKCRLAIEPNQFCGQLFPDSQWSGRAGWGFQFVKRKRVCALAIGSYLDHGRGSVLCDPE